MWSLEVGGVGVVGVCSMVDFTSDSMFSMD